MSSWGFIMDSRIEVETSMSGVSRNRFCQEASATRQHLNIPHTQCCICSGEFEDEMIPCVGFLVYILPPEMTWNVLGWSFGTLVSSTCLQGSI